MKTTKFALAVLATLAATMAHAGDSVPFPLDTMDGPRVARATEPLAYSTDWNAGAGSVAISVDGEEVFSAVAPTSGDYVWNAGNTPLGLHTLTLYDGVETLSAQFQVNGILFEVNGGEGTMAPFYLYEGMSPSLPRCAFWRMGYTFVGWATEADGPVMYADGETVSGGIDATDGGTVTLYARLLPVNPVFTGWFSEHAGTYPAAAMGTWSAHDGDEAAVGQDGLLAFSTSSRDGLWYDPAEEEPEETRTVIALSVRFCVGPGPQSMPDIQDTSPYGALTAVDIFDGRGAAYYALDANRGWVRLSGAVPDPSRPVEVEMEASFAGETPATTYRVDGVTLHDAADASCTAFPMPGIPTRIHQLGFSGNGTLGLFSGEWWKGGNDPDGRLNVRFDPNGGEGDAAEHSVAVGTDQTLSPPFRERAGYSLVGWATSPSGMVVVATNANLRIAASQSGLTTLYAVWTPHQYEVRFNRGAGAGSMPNQQLTYDVAAYLTSNAFTRTGYTFAGWTTEEGGAKVFDDGAEVLNLATNEGAVVDLYAIWVTNTYSVIFDANGGTGTMVPQAFTYDAPQALNSNAFTRANRFFAGWATAADGAVVYADGEEVANLTAEADGEVTLYAVWADSRIVFDANGGEGAMAPFYLFAGAEQTLPESTVTKDGHFLLGWALAPDSEATLFDGDSTTDIVAAPGETVTLYAVWHEGNAQNAYAVRFDANGGEGTMPKRVYAGGDDVTLPERIFIRDGYFYQGWATSPDGEIVYDPGEMVIGGLDAENQEIVTLYAIWPEVFSLGNGFWEVPDGDGPIMPGAPLVAPSGDVVIPSEIDGRPVVAIGAEAFAGNTAITAITIPASVTNVAEGAFEGCTGIRSVSVTSLYGCEKFAELFPELAETVERVVFLDGVAEIPDNFFEGCTALRSMDIADSVAEIGTNVFEACSALATTTVDGLVFYQGWVLGFAEGASPMSQVASLEIPAEYEGAARPAVAPYQTEVVPVRGIAAGAFEGETGIATVSLPESLVFIGAESFANCTGLGSVAVPEGVAKIDRNAFRNCTRAQGLALPESLRVIADGAFANGTRLQSVSIPQGVEEIGGCAFSNCWRVTSVSIPQSVERIGDGAFADCENVAGAVVPLHVRPMAELFPAAYATMTDAWVAELPDGSPGELAPPEAEGSSPGGLAPPEAEGGSPGGLAPPEAEGGSPGGLAPPFETRQMVPGMFAGCEAVESIALPEWVRNVPDGAFEGCAAISALAFPDAVTNIGARACASMAALESVTFPAALETIGEEAFDGDAGIDSLALPDGLREIGARAFRGLALLARADIPASVRAIGDGAFADCAAVRAVSMPGDAGTVADAFPDAYANLATATVVAEADEGGAPGGRARPTLRNQLFAGCAALTQVELPQDLAEIGESAFAGCSALAEVGIPSAVTNIGASAFANCSTLSSIALPKSLAVLQNGVFTGCSALAGITIPEGVGEIGGAIFDGCTLLRSVRFVGNAPAYSSAGAGPYAGVPAGCVTYVPNGSTGWDGIASSQDLPRYWPAGTTYRIDWWDPNRLTVSFDLCDGTAPTEVGQVTGTSYVLPAEPTRQGATFGGWWTLPENGARVTASTQVTAIGDYTVYAHWTMNRYAVRFDANGGRGAAEPFAMTVGTPEALPPCPFAYVAHSFLGWATAPGGPVAYADGATVSDLAYANGASVTLYAVWTERE